MRLAKHLRRAKSGEDIYSEEGTSNYGVPTRLFDRFPKFNRKRFTAPWYVFLNNHNNIMMIKKVNFQFSHVPRALTLMTS